MRGEMGFINLRKRRSGLRFTKVIHYLLSLLLGIVSFLTAYGLLQYFITRNIAGNSAVSEIVKLAFNFAAAGLVSGAVYAVTFRHGNVSFAVAPAILVGGSLLTLAIAHGKIGGIESTTINAWEFAVPVIVGILCGFVGAKMVHRIIAPTKT